MVLDTPTPTSRMRDFVTAGVAAGPNAALLEQIRRRRANDNQVQHKDPYQRISGSLEIHCEVDLDRRRVSDVASVATMFRGYEALLARRGLREAGLVSSTAAGICGGVHATASSLCLEMALDVAPPPMGIVARNLLLCCEYLNDNPMHLFVLSGPDYSAQTFARTNPELLAKAENTPTHHQWAHGHATVGQLMRALDRPSGGLFIEALRMAGCAREAYTILGGKFPHSESIIPGGVHLDLSLAKLDAFAAKLRPFIDYAKKCVAIWDEMFDFLYEAEPRYVELGRAPATMVDWGQWDHDEHYDASFARCERWGRARWSTPGVVIDGRLVTTSLREINLGLENFIDRSHHAVGEQFDDTDPLGGTLPTGHPWNRQIRAADPLDHDHTYSWASALHWRGHAFEVGAYARLYISALAKSIPSSEWLESTGDSVRFHVPAGDRLDSRDLQWRIPPVWNAFERNRARAYAVAYNLMVTFENIERARRLYRTGNTRLHTPFEIPSDDARRFGVGFCGAGRGFLAHWAVIEAGRFSNYQIAVPSRINAGPRGPDGQLGPIERALSSSPLIESTRPDQLEFIDLVRTVQSFDPCMTCSAHIRIANTDVVVDRTITTSGP
jgi:hydrogenase large subunit